MNKKTKTEPLKQSAAAVDPVPPAPPVHPKSLDPRLLRFPIGPVANTQDDLDDMWDNLPV